MVPLDPEGGWPRGVTEGQNRGRGGSGLGTEGSAASSRFDHETGNGDAHPHVVPQHQTAVNRIGSPPYDCNGAAGGRWVFHRQWREAVWASQDLNTKQLLAVGKAVGRQLLAVTKRLEGTWGRGDGGGYTPALQAQACPSPTPTALDSTSPGRSRRATGRAA